MGGGGNNQVVLVKVAPTESHPTGLVYGRCRVGVLCKCVNIRKCCTVGIRYVPYMVVGIVLGQEGIWTHRMHTHAPHSAESAKLTWLACFMQKFFIISSECLEFSFSLYMYLFNLSSYTYSATA